MLLFKTIIFHRTNFLEAQLIIKNDSKVSLQIYTKTNFFEILCKDEKEGELFLSELFTYLK